MAYRVQLTKLEQHASNLLKGNLLKKAPVWLHAVRAVPPGPSIIRSRNPNANVSAHTDVEKELFTNAKQQQQATSSTRHKQKHLRTRPPRPAQIVYPEDRMRRQFYKDHPFELARPQSLVENKLGLNRTDYSQLLLPDMLPEEVTGETVIKYQLHLVTNEKMPERKAYAKATSEFYEIRARQEEVERQMRSQMDAALQELESKKWTRQALELEERALKEGQERVSI
ncbi:mitochondrial ribosomal protein S25 [Zychaea mexicana]|uniref:mitochondrial ribosomal protein S25 n=1 Tax=Zychaea mexicana TaxID=64656 RepID=UPI0022FF053F|nr:mitochondrial ribosomal protein S25 [Zychaea mexicana]KAI9491848.1 mitochondrial ribosomal protein S25 [Zychaea mexicana]